MILATSKVGMASKRNAIEQHYKLTPIMLLMGSSMRKSNLGYWDRTHELSAKWRPATRQVVASPQRRHQLFARGKSILGKKSRRAIKLLMIKFFILEILLLQLNLHPVFKLRHELRLWLLLRDRDGDTARQHPSYHQVCLIPYL